MFASHNPIHRMVFLEKPKTWAESEERRRLFWSVFLLDRFCSISTGWNPSLTSADVRRRLPCNDAIWEAENPVRTCYFGINDRAYSLYKDSNDVVRNTAEELTSIGAIGAFAYFIEATESLVRFLNIQFLKFRTHILPCQTESSNSFLSAARCKFTKP